MDTYAESLLPFLDTNVAALARVQKKYSDLRRAYKNDPKAVTDHLRMCGFRCSRCGGTVTGSNCKWFNFYAIVQCWPCQHNMNK